MQILILEIGVTEAIMAFEIFRDMFPLMGIVKYNQIASNVWQFEASHEVEMDELEGELVELLEQSPITDWTYKIVD